jgi:hypothetical protein
MVWKAGRRVPGVIAILTSPARPAKRGHRIACALVAGAVALMAPVRSHAHFVLVAPDSWMSQDQFGLPEKLGPCGDEGGGTPTGKLTAFRPGQTIAITIDEVIMHPGHYRVALAIDDRGELPPEPAVTPTRNDPCASVAIQDPPIFPILVDNALPHTTAFGAPQTFMVTLPTDVTCSKCTLQVLEFMSSHGAPCFYHHCADISIQGEPDTATPTPSPTPTSVPTLTPSASPTHTRRPSPTPTSLRTPTVTALPCVGDCDHDHSVAPDELVVGVRIALGELSLEFCQALAADTQGPVTVDELVSAARNALSSCR